MTTDREADQLLVERARAGERDAFNQLVAKYQRRLMRLLTRLLNDSAEAEDVVQETFIKAYRALRHFRGDAAFYTWLYRIAINSAKNVLLGRKRHATQQAELSRPSSSASTAPGGAAADAAPPAPAGPLADEDRLRDINTPESVLASKQIAQTVNAAMDALPIDLRTAIALREIEGLSYEEIAQIMDCPIGTVRSRIFRAREAIARKLRPLLDLPADKRW